MKKEKEHKCKCNHDSKKDHQCCGHHHHHEEEHHCCGHHHHEEHHCCGHHSEHVDVKNPLEDVLFIELDEKTADKLKLGRQKVLIPVQTDKKEIKAKDIKDEQILGGMLKVLAYDENHKYIDLYKKYLLESNKDIANEFTLAGIAQANEGKYENALELFLAVNHLDPSIIESFVNLAVIYGQLSNVANSKNDNALAIMYLKKVLEILHKGLEIHKDNSSLQFELGSFYLFIGNYEEAKKYLSLCKDKLEDEQKNEQVISMLNIIEKEKGEQEELIKAYDFLMMNKEEDAIKILDNIISKDESFWNAIFLKGWALRKLEKYEEAEKTLLKALEKGGVEPEVYNELSICAQATGKIDLAIEYLETASDLGENINVIANLALLYFNKKDYDNASSLIIKAYNLDSKDPGVKHLIDLYENEVGEKLNLDLVIESEDENNN